MVCLSSALLLAGMLMVQDAPPAGTEFSAVQPPPFGHHEKPDNPPGTVLRPARPKVLPSHARSGALYAYPSTQVNVDANGDNIWGDAANEPSIAVDPTNPQRIVIGWRQFNTITSNFRQGGWAYSADGGQTWTFPGVLESIFRSDPVLDCDATGTFCYLSLNEAYQCGLFKSTSGGQTWAAPLSAYGGDKPWMAIDRTGGVGHGHIYVGWQRNYNCCGSRIFTRSTNGGASFLYPVTVPNSPSFGTIAVGPDGAVYVAGCSAGSGSIDFNTFKVAKSTNAKNAGTSPTFTTRTVNLGGAMAINTGPNPVGLLGQANVAVDHSGGATHNRVYLLCSVDPAGSDPLDVMITRSTDGGVNWSAPVRVNDDPVGTNAWQWFGALAVAPTGRVDVVWNDSRNSPGGQAQLFYACSFDGGVTWSANQAVSPLWDPMLGWPQQNKIGDYIEVESDTAGARVAYAATLNGEEDVFYIRLGDCNGNGIHDLLDLSGGGSTDVNANHVPDECEDCNGNGVPDDLDLAAGAPDCNGSGVPDECDLAAGTSADCNGNTVPDECDIAGGAELDCNANGLPDSCEVAGGTGDCDANGVPDDCDLFDPNLDCNANGVLDACEGGTDCNGNGRLDSCDLAAALAASSPVYSPLGGVVHTLWLTDPPDAAGDVLLTFQAEGDLNYMEENVAVDVNGVVLGVVFDGAHEDCQPTGDTLTVPAATWNAAKAGGDAALHLVPSEEVAAGVCPDSYLQVTVTYAAVPPSFDVNGNGVPDECEAPPLCRGDCDCDGAVGFADIDYFVAAIPDNAAAWAAKFPGGVPPPGCTFANCDASGDGNVGFDDIDPFVALIPSVCP